jgi:L-cystine transport system permease protein
MVFDFHFMFNTFLLALKGIPMTLMLTGLSLLIALPVGFLMAVVRRNKVPVASQLIAVFVSYMRGTPLLLQIFLLYNLLPTALNIIFLAMHMSVNIFKVNNAIYAVIVFALCETAILSEVFRSALGTVDKGQQEAAYTVGLTPFQAYARIIIPQAIVSALPVLCNSTTDLIKMTSLAFSMSVMDMTAIAKMEANMKLSYIEAYISIFFLYLILVLVVEFIFRCVERRVRVYQAV